MKLFDRFGLVAMLAICLMVMVLGEASAFGGRCRLFSRLRPSAGCDSTSACPTGPSAQTNCVGCGSAGQFPTAANFQCNIQPSLATAGCPCPAQGQCGSPACPTCGASCPTPTAVGGPIVNPNWKPINVGSPLPTAPLAPGGIQCRMILVNGQWVQVCR